MEVETTSVVVAFCDSPTLRETLSVLLEDECALRFLSPEAATTPVDSATDVAVVATQRPTGLLHNLMERWPAVPIVVVDTQTTRPRTLPSSAPTDSLVRTVPLDPYAIRQAVLERLTARPHNALRATIRSIAETLRAELTYSFTALRTLTASPAADPEPVTRALLGTIIREQTHALDANVDHLYRFRDRPRAVELSPHFVSALCRQLEQPDRETVERGLLCKSAAEASSTQSAGPLTLVPAITGFLRAHLRRRSASTAVSVQATQRGVLIRYQPRGVGSPGIRSWPLLLASLALQPWSWRVYSTTSPQQETVGLYPA